MPVFAEDAFPGKRFYAKRTLPEAASVKSARVVRGPGVDLRKLIERDNPPPGCFKTLIKFYFSFCLVECFFQLPLRTVKFIRSTRQNQPLSLRVGQSQNNSRGTLLMRSQVLCGEHRWWVPRPHQRGDSKLPSCHC